MRARIAIGLAALAFGGTIGVRGLAAQQQHKVFVSVVDSRGVPVLDLRADAFKVFENQMPARTIKVEPIDWPMKLTVLVDNGLGTDTYLANLRTGLRYFFNEIPDEVEMSLLTLAPQPRWVIKPTTELDKLVKGVDLISPDHGISRFFDALSEAAARFDKEKGRYFPVVVIVTSDVGSVDAPFAQDYERLNQRQGQRADRALRARDVRDAKDHRRRDRQRADPCRPCPHRVERRPLREYCGAIETRDAVTRNRTADREESFQADAPVSRHVRGAPWRSEGRTEGSVGQRQRKQRRLHRADPRRTPPVDALRPVRPVS